MYFKSRSSSSYKFSSKIHPRIIDVTNLDPKRNYGENVKVAGSRDQIVMTWIKWNMIIATPKAWGGWALKNIPLSTKYLTEKVGWILLTTHSLWTSMVHMKYIFPNSIEDWIRIPHKSRTNVSIIWKVVIGYFHISEVDIAWGVANGARSKVRCGSWINFCEAYLLPRALVVVLNNGGIYTQSNTRSSPHQHLDARLVMN